MLDKVSDGFKGKNHDFLTFLGGIYLEPGFEQPALLYTISIYIASHGYFFSPSAKKRIYIAEHIYREPKKKFFRLRRKEYIYNIYYAKR